MRWWCSSLVVFHSMQRHTHMQCLQHCRLLSAAQVNALCCSNAVGSLTLIFEMLTKKELRRRVRMFVASLSMVGNKVLSIKAGRHLIYSSHYRITFRKASV